jgi:hypothetical protein
MDKGKGTIREGETSQWIREKGQSEKERHQNGEGKKDNQRRRDITVDKGKRTIREGETSKWITFSDCPFSLIHCDVSPSLIIPFPLSNVMSLLL